MSYEKVSGCYAQLTVVKKKKKNCATLVTIRDRKITSLFENMQKRKLRFTPLKLLYLNLTTNHCLRSTILLKAMTLEDKDH